MRRSLVLVALLLAARPARADDLPVEVVLAFPDEPWTCRHHVEEEFARGAHGVRRYSVEARVEYRVVLRHPAEGARVEAVLRQARWSGPTGRSAWSSEPPPIQVLEVAGGG